MTSSRPPVSGVLPITIGAVGFDVGEGIAVAGEIGHVLLAGPAEAAAGDRRRAFEQVAGRGALRDLRQIVVGPAEFMHHRRQKQRRIGHPAGQHDRRAGVERFADHVGAEIGVGGNHLRQDGFQRLAVLDQRQVRPDASRCSTRRRRARRRPATSPRPRSAASLRAARAPPSGLAAPMLLTMRMPLACRSAAPCAGARAATANSRVPGLCCAPDFRARPCARRGIRTPGNRYRRARPVPAPAPCGRPRCPRRRRRVSFRAISSGGSSRPLLLLSEHGRLVARASNKEHRQAYGNRPNYYWTAMREIPKSHIKITIMTVGGSS